MIKIIEISKNGVSIYSGDSITVAQIINNLKNEKLTEFSNIETNTARIYYGKLNDVDYTWVIVDTPSVQMRVPVPNGELIADTALEPYAGIDIEYRDNNENSNPDISTRPRVLIEKASNEDTLRAAVWKGVLEDYDENIILNKNYWAENQK